MFDIFIHCAFVGAIYGTLLLCPGLSRGFISERPVDVQRLYVTGNKMKTGCLEE